MYKMTFVVVAILVAVSTGWAKSPQPNLIACTDADKTVTLTYAAWSILGQPQFFLTVDGTQLFPPPSLPWPDPEGLTRIVREATVFGTFVYAMDATGTPLTSPPMCTASLYRWWPWTPASGRHFPPCCCWAVSAGGRSQGALPNTLTRAIEIQCEGSVVAF